MALDQFKKDITELHGKLVDIVEEIEKLGEGVPAHQLDPIITSNLASRINNVVDHVDHALVGLVDTVEFSNNVGVQSSTSEDPDEAYKETIGTVAQKANTPPPIDPRASVATDHTANPVVIAPVPEPTPEADVPAPVVEAPVEQPAVATDTPTT